MRNAVKKAMSDRESHDTDPMRQTTKAPLCRDVDGVSVLQRCVIFFFSSRRRHTRCSRDWSSDVCSSDLFDSQTQTLSREIAKRQRKLQELRTHLEKRRPDSPGKAPTLEGVQKKVKGILREIGRASCRERV